MKFLGYRRPDGGIGIRNHVLIIPTVSCVNRVASDVANKTGRLRPSRTPMGALSTQKKTEQPNRPSLGWVGIQTRLPC